PGEPSGQAGLTECAGRAEQRPREQRAPGHAQPQAREQGTPALAEWLCPGALEPPAIAHAGGADRLAAPAPETRVEVGDQPFVVGLELPALERPHEYDPLAWAVRLVPGGQVGRARRETEAAVHAGVERLV